MIKVDQITYNFDSEKEFEDLINYLDKQGDFTIKRGGDNRKAGYWISSKEDLRSLANSVRPRIGPAYKLNVFHPEELFPLIEKYRNRKNKS